jgi:hypothetical protein
MPEARSSACVPASLKGINIAAGMPATCISSINDEYLGMCISRHLQTPFSTASLRTFIAAMHHNFSELQFAAHADGRIPGFHQAGFKSTGRFCVRQSTAS